MRIETESTEAKLAYWGKFPDDELQECRHSLQRDLDAGFLRSGATAQWIDEIDTVLESRKQSA